MVQLVSRVVPIPKLSNGAQTSRGWEVVMDEVVRLAGKKGVQVRVTRGITPKAVQSAASLYARQKGLGPYVHVHFSKGRKRAVIWCESTNGSTPRPVKPPKDEA